jgi:hypothetical protein
MNTQIRFEDNIYKGVIFLLLFTILSLWSFVKKDNNELHTEYVNKQEIKNTKEFNFPVNNLPSIRH